LGRLAGPFQGIARAGKLDDVRQLKLLPKTKERNKMNIDQVLTKALELGQGAKVDVTLVTNQPSGVVSYATGQLVYYPASQIGTIYRFERLSTSRGDALKYYFSDRLRDVDPPQLVPLPRQPFNVDATDKLGMSLSKSLSGMAAKFTLVSWQNTTFTVVLNPLGDLLVGLGPAIGNQPGQAAYVISFARVYTDVI
jgi:hypothetical protein